MIITSHHRPKATLTLKNYLQQKIGLSDKALDLGLRQAHIEQAPLPIVLWSFGLLSLHQYQQVLNWQRDNYNS